MTPKEKATRAVAILEEKYPDASCALHYEKPYELLIATRLSAQCTDKRVNLVTSALFEKYPTLQAFASAPLEELEQMVHPCGFYRAKAKSIKEMASMLLSRFDGEVPNNMNDLLTLPGVGRKTANLILGDIFRQPAVVADTHFIRIMGRLGLTHSENPAVVERDLRDLLAPEKSSDFCHRVVWFGRDTCTARNPKCEGCAMRRLCEYEKEK